MTKGEQTCSSAGDANVFKTEVIGNKHAVDTVGPPHRRVSLPQIQPTMGGNY